MIEDNSDKFYQYIPCRFFNIQLLFQHLQYFFLQMMIPVFYLLFLLLIFRAFSMGYICMDSFFFELNKSDLQNATSIYSKNCVINEYTVTRMTQNTHTLPNLINLTLIYGYITTNVFNILFSLNMPKLRLLNLANNPLSDMAIQNLSSTALENVTYLNLNNTNLTAKVFEYLNQKSLSNLEQLNLSYNNFEDQFHIALKTPSLKALYIDGTSIKYFPLKEFSPNIQYLSLNDAHLTDSFFQIISQYKNLDSLKILRLNNNQKFTIKGFNILSSISMKSLIQLSVLGIGINDIELNLLLNHAPSLQIFIAQSNRFTDKSLKKYLEAHRKIRQLNVKLNYIYSLAGFQYLCNCTTKLIISNNYIQDLYFENLAHLTQLEVLKAQQNLITDEGLIKLKYVKYTKLKTLTLQQNPLGNRTLGILATMGLHSLQLLDLSNSNIGGSQQNVTLNLPNLKYLYMVKNRLQNNDLKILSGISSSELQILYIKDNLFDDIGLAFLGRINLSKLRFLAIINCKITGKGFSSFPKQNLISLTQLYLVNNLLNTEGIKVFSRLRLLKLRILFFNNNQLDDECMDILSNFEMYMLNSINLQGNLITNKGLIHLAKNSLPNLRYICLNENQIDQNAIVYFIQNHMEITILLCNKCRIGNPFFERLPIQFIHNVQILFLDRNFLDDDSMLQLSKNSIDMMWLQILLLAYNSITDIGLDIFSKMEFLNLRSLDLHGNEISVQKRAYFLQNHRIPNLVQVGLGIDDMDYTKFKQMSAQPFFVG